MKTGEARDVFVLGRIACGDAEAFRDLFDRQAPAVLGFLVSVLGDRGVAERVLEEVFRDVWALAGRFPAGEESPQRWLLGLARSQAVASLRSRLDGRAPPARALQARGYAAASSA